MKKISGGNKIAVEYQESGITPMAVQTIHHQGFYLFIFFIMKALVERWEWVWFHCFLLTNPQSTAVLTVCPVPLLQTA